VKRPSSKRGIRFSVTWKLAILAVIAITMVNLYSFVVAIPMMQSKQIEERKEQVRVGVQTAHGMLQQYQNLEATGVLTASDAQQYSLAAIEQLSYGDSNEGYFWVTDHQPILLADPSKPTLVGTDVGSVRDADGRFIFADMASLASGGGEGFYEYRRAADGARQVAYIKSFEPWGWVAASAVPIDDLMSLAGLNKWTLGAIGGLFACLVVLFFVIAVHKMISRPLLSVARAWDALAEGEADHTFEVRSRDEVGAVARSCRQVLFRMKEMIGVAERVAAGDLTVEIKPLSDKDTMMKAFARMAENQRNLIDKLKSAAGGVAEASRQLTRASEQTAQVTQEIAATIQQVARGASEQSRALQETAGNTDQLARSIDQIARGAQEQAADVAKANATVNRVWQAIVAVSANAEAGAEAWRSTAESAADGARKTHETATGMEKMKRAMDTVSVRMADLGNRSEEIGKIVATIDDIAAQTNLLALNAAIEAARAGEQGRGFAVVADEVRKLAERSSLATREIAGIVDGIQSGVREAVSAMEQGSREVEAGYGLATDAGAALDDILARSRSVGDQVQQISVAARELNQLSTEMTGAIDRINRIVEQNAAATQQMKMNSESVSVSVENSAGVAQENSASAEQVSASVEEMSAQVEETLAAAQSLTDMSGELEKTAAVFKTDVAS
jgi:methyl-accepting chemotaxis protein